MTSVTQVLLTHWQALARVPVDQPDIAFFDGPLDQPQAADILRRIEDEAALEHRRYIPLNLDGIPGQSAVVELGVALTVVSRRVQVTAKYIVERRGFEVEGLAVVGGLDLARAGVGAPEQVLGDAPAQVDPLAEERRPSSPSCARNSPRCPGSGCRCPSRAWRSVTWNPLSSSPRLASSTVQPGRPVPPPSSRGARGCRRSTVVGRAQWCRARRRIRQARSSDPPL